MTPNKCEHLGGIDWEQNAEKQPGGPGWKPVFSCVDCGQRFVPEDLLRAARAYIQADLDLTDNYLPHAEYLLERIDEVLGK